jgi:hypothetical protein
VKNEVQKLGEMNKRDSNLKVRFGPNSFLLLPIFYAAVQRGAHRSRFSRCQF